MMENPCIRVSSTWWLENGEVAANECFVCKEEKPGARRPVGSRSGNIMMLFLCHDCEDRRNERR